MPRIALRGTASGKERRSRRYHFWFEPLDQRLALAGIAVAMSDFSATTAPALRVDAVVPVQNTWSEVGSTVASGFAPAFSVYFNRPVDSLSYLGQNFRIEQINRDGSISPLSASTVPYTEVFNQADPTSSSLTMSFRSALKPGRYRIVLAGTNVFTDRNGHETKTVDQLIEIFSVGTQELDAIPSRVPGTITGATTLSFPVINNTLDSTFNKVVLPSGSAWSLNPLFGGRDPDDYRVTLFDSNKELLISTIGSDLSSLRGLPGGTYFLRLYQTRPSPSAPESSMDVAFEASKLLGTPGDLTTIMPLNYNGTGGNIDSLLVRFADFDSAAMGLGFDRSRYFVVDAAGRDWSAKPVGYEPTTHRLLLTLASELPTGQYTLEVRPLDSSPGENPVRRSIGTFGVIARPLPPRDLGTIFPRAAESKWLSSTDLAGGQAISLRFSVVETQFYQVVLANDLLRSRLYRVNPAGSAADSNQVVSDDLGENFYLEPGVYQLVVSNPTTARQAVMLRVSATDSLAESLSVGGVGQLPASLRQATLVGGPTSTCALTSPVKIPFASLAATTADARTDQRGAAARSARGNSVPNYAVSGHSSGEISGSFSLSSFQQTPLGAFAPSGMPASLAAPSNSTLMVSLIVAMKDTIGINPTTPTLRASSTRGNFKTELAAAALPSGESVLVEADPTLRDSSGRREVLETDQAEGDHRFSHQGSSIEVTRANDPATLGEAIQVAGVDWVEPCSALEPELTADRVELANMASPISILIAGCWVGQRLSARLAAPAQATRSHASKLLKQTILWLRRYVPAAKVTHPL